MDGQHSRHRNVRRFACRYLGGMAGAALIMAVLHYLYGDFEAGGIQWFHLDKERNLPTWFSGVLLTLLGGAAISAYVREYTVNTRAELPPFRLPVLWLGVGIIALGLSLDELTILHENLLWRETRLFSHRTGRTWVFLTQWQLLFAPLIVLLLAYLVMFFSHRYRASPWASRTLGPGLACWLLALFLESIRSSFLQAGSSWYNPAVVLEETSEMLGAIILLASVVFYTIDITLDLSPQRYKKIRTYPKLWNKQSVVALTATVLAIALMAALAYHTAGNLARTDAPLPVMHRRALPP